MLPDIRNGLARVAESQYGLGRSDARCGDDSWNTTWDHSPFVEKRAIGGVEKFLLMLELVVDREYGG
jgi:hypothetical protein